MKVSSIQPTPNPNAFKFHVDAQLAPAGQSRSFDRPEAATDDPLALEDAHGPVTGEQVSRNLDFFDMAFGRRTARSPVFPERLIHVFDWQSWKAEQRVSDLTPPGRASTPASSTSTASASPTTKSG